MVTGLGAYSSYWFDPRTTTTDAAAKGWIGLSAAQSYLQQNYGTVNAVAPTDSADKSDTVFWKQRQSSRNSGTDSNASDDGQNSSFTQSQTSSSFFSLPGFQLSASFGPMLAIQEAGSQWQQDGASSSFDATSNLDSQSSDVADSTDGLSADAGNQDSSTFLGTSTSSIGTQSVSSSPFAASFGNRDAASNGGIIRFSRAASAYGAAQGLGLRSGAWSYADATGMTMDIAMPGWGSIGSSGSAVNFSV